MLQAENHDTAVITMLHRKPGFALWRTHHTSQTTFLLANRRAAGKPLRGVLGQPRIPQDTQRDPVHTGAGLAPAQTLPAVVRAPVRTAPPS